LISIFLSIRRTLKGSLNPNDNVQEGRFQRVQAKASFEHPVQRRLLHSQSADKDPDAPQEWPQNTYVRSTLAATEAELFGIPHVQQSRHWKYHINIGFRSSVPIASLRHYQNPSHWLQ
jgi:hypothetical protein